MRKKIIPKIVKLSVEFNFINDKIKLIDCGGWPKPHEINNIPYIVENWQKI